VLPGSHLRELDRIAPCRGTFDGIVWSAFGTSGQRCTAASRVIVQDGVYDELQARLVAAAERLRLGVGWDEEVDVGPVINRAALEKIDSYTRVGRDEGAQLLTGGEVATGDGLDRGFFYRPTVFGDVEPGMRIAQEEIFGPVLSVIRVPDDGSALSVANGVRFGLSASVYTSDVASMFRFVDRLDAGIIHVNSPTVGGEAHVPFGGMKATGVGLREMGRVAIDFYTELKVVYVDYTGAPRGGNLY
jgi:alpha-ketoglutaric semialdehyde dehydrogenase